jgi:hypothetical protein
VSWSNADTPQCGLREGRLPDDVLVKDRLARETPDGRQHVVDDDGELVFGVWYMPHDESDEAAVIDAPPILNAR